MTEQEFINQLIVLERPLVALVKYNDLPALQWFVRKHMSVETHSISIYKQLEISHNEQHDNKRYYITEELQFSDLYAQYKKDCVVDKLGEE